MGEEVMDEEDELAVEKYGAEAEGGGLGEYLLLLEATGLLTQDADPDITTLIDSHNGFNELSLLAMLWTVRHRWPSGARFALNCYKHWAQLLLCHPGTAPVIIDPRGGYPW